jgi:hypothetical protein
MGRQVSLTGGSERVDGLVRLHSLKRVTQRVPSAIVDNQRSTLIRHPRRDFTHDGGGLGANLDNIAVNCVGQPVSQFGNRHYRAKPEGQRFSR